MSPNRVLAASGARFAATAIAAIAMIFSFSILASASASSGGIGTGSGGGGHKSHQAEPSTLDQHSRKYSRLWHRVSRADKRWARSTSECESGGNPDAIGGGGTYRGAFQFTRRTWSSSPKSPGGDPIRYAYRTQAVVAVALKKREGTRPWPVCG